MTKVEAINKALEKMEDWKQEHDYCLTLDKSYPAVKKEYDEISLAQMHLNDIKKFLEEG